jgi:hypothetical protein
MSSIAIRCTNGMTIRAYFYLHGRNELLSQPIVDAFSPNPFLPEDPRSEAGKNFCALNSGSPEVELRFCPWIIVFKYFNLAAWPESSLCLYNVCMLRGVRPKVSLRSASGDRTSSSIHVHRMTKNSASVFNNCTKCTSTVLYSRKCYNVDQLQDHDAECKLFIGIKSANISFLNWT